MNYRYSNIKTNELLIDHTHLGDILENLQIICRKYDFCYPKDFDIAVSHFREELSNLALDRDFNSTVKHSILKQKLISENKRLVRGLKVVIAKKYIVCRKYHRLLQLINSGKEIDTDKFCKYSRLKKSLENEKISISTRQNLIKKLLAEEKL